MAELATIARPYAEALYKAIAGGDGQQTQQWLDAFAQVASSADVQRVALSPKVTRAQLRALFTGADAAGVPALATNFLDVIIENGRIAALPQIASQFHAFVNEKAGVADAVVYSAFPLSDDQLEALRPALEKRFGCRLNLSVEADESLIGGVRVLVGDEEYDTSVKFQLNQMKAALTA